MRSGYDVVEDAERLPRDREPARRVVDVDLGAEEDEWLAALGVDLVDLAAGGRDVGLVGGVEVHVVRGTEPLDEPPRERDVDGRVERVGFLHASRVAGVDVVVEVLHGLDALVPGVLILDPTTTACFKKEVPAPIELRDFMPVMFVRKKGLYQPSTLVQD
jgi:hypothetical protein